MKYWLLKSEPATFGIDDLALRPDQTTCWEGVRNYQARNLLRDEFQVGDRCFFYHSSCKVPAVMGTVTVVRSSYPDHHAFDPKHAYFDPKSDPTSPTWMMVDVKLDDIFPAPVTLSALRTMASQKGSPLADLMLLRKGSRLSVQPVTKKQFDAILKVGRSA